MWQYTSEGNGRADERVEFLVTADGKLQMARGDTLDLEILGGVARQFEDFGSKVLEDGGEVDGGFGTDARLLSGNRSEVALYAAAGELDARVSTSGLLHDAAHRNKDACAAL